MGLNLKKEKNKTLYKFTGHKFLEILMVKVVVGKSRLWQKPRLAKDWLE
jgi:hypothetical protein